MKRVNEQHRQREQPAALYPLEWPEPAGRLVAGPLRVAVRSQALRECSPGDPALRGGREEQNWLRRLSGGLSAKANLLSLVNHWLMIHAVQGTFGLVVTRGVR